MQKPIFGNVAIVRATSPFLRKGASAREQMSADAILEAVRALRLEEPGLGVKPLVARLREQSPDLGAGAKEVREVLKTLDEERAAAEAAAAPPPASDDGQQSLPRKKASPPHPRRRGSLRCCRGQQRQEASSRSSRS